MIYEEFIINLSFAIVQLDYIWTDWSSNSYWSSKSSEALALKSLMWEYDWADTKFSHSIYL